MAPPPSSPSKWGKVQPPSLKSPDVSSCGPPGACMTPSRLMKAERVIRRMAMSHFVWFRWPKDGSARRVPTGALSFFEEMRSRRSTADEVHADARGCADEQEKAHARLDEESGQTLLYRLPVSEEIDDAATDPDEPQDRGADVAQVDGAEPQWHQEGRQPFERVHVDAKDALEVGVAGDRRVFDAEFHARDGDACRQEEIQGDGEQRDDCGVACSGHGGLSLS